MLGGRPQSGGYHARSGCRLDRPATEGPNKGVRDAGGVGCGGRANPETVTGIVPLYAGGCQGRAKPVTCGRDRGTPEAKRKSGPGASPRMER